MVKEMMNNIDPDDPVFRNFLGELSKAYAVPHLGSRLSILTKVKMYTAVNIRD